MRILGVDQSLTASAAVLLKENQPGQLVIGQQYIFRPKTTGIHRMMEIRAWMEATVRDAAPDVLAREQHNMRQFGAAGAIQSLTAVLDMIAYERSFLGGKRYAIIAPGTWKKFCIGKGNLKKDTAYMMHLNKFFNSTKMLATPAGFEVEDDNIADAICIGVTGYSAYRLVRGDEEIVMTKATRDFMKKAIHNMFDYGSV